jgi:hypothetical protein
LENNQPNTNVSTSKKKIIAIAMAVLVITLTVGLASAILMNGQNPSSTQTGNNQNTSTNTQTNPQSWMKAGAYATYEGQVSILGIDVSFNAKMEIVDLNDTHIQVATDYNMSTPYGTTENQTTTWISKSDMTFQSEGMILNNSYNTQITLAKLGTRSCTVYEYSNDGINAAYYVDNTIHWPIKMVMTSPTSVDGQSYNMEINLTDSNIPGL